jgi:hypothetical protein
MRLQKLSWFAFLLGVTVAPGVANAEQPRDWMVAAQPSGTYANLDVIFPGVQAQLEHRIPIYGKSNELDFKVNALPTALFYESQADVDLRILILSLGASVGFRDVFHNIATASSAAISITRRRASARGASRSHCLSTITSCCSVSMRRASKAATTAPSTGVSASFVTREC